MNTGCVLVITGCISPNKNVPFLTVKDSSEREKQYIDSLMFYIRECSVRKIVFCDSSDSKCPTEIIDEAARYQKEFEWLSFQGDTEKIIERGKGYGEGEILKYALDNSRVIAEADYLIKITGRVKVRNINILVRHMRKDRIYFQRNSASSVETVIYGMPLEIYKAYFQECYKEVYDRRTHYLEHTFSDSIRDNSLKTFSFIVYPDLQGVSGSTGQSYAVPLIGRIKRTIKNYLLVFFKRS